MSLKTVWILYKKELLDVIRDKKSLIVTLLLPLVLYPVLFTAVGAIMSFVGSKENEEIYRIAVPQTMEVQDVLFSELMTQSNQLLFVEADDPARALADKEIAAYLELEEKEGQQILHICYDASESKSENAMNVLKDGLNEYLVALTEDRVREAGLPVNTTLYPMVIEEKDISSNEEFLGTLIGTAAPGMLIIFVFTAAYSPAMDTTTGERERGTMELLLTMPLTRLELIAGKFLLVATVAVVATLMNTISIGILMLSIGNMARMLGSGSITINLMEFLPGLCLIFVCVLAFAMFISALIMCVCTFAKSFKEASSYMSPLMMVVMLTGYVAYIPGTTLTLPLAAVPVANICLLIKDAVSFRYEPVLILIVLCSNIIYAFAAIWVLSRIYDSETVLFGEGVFNIKLFEKRSDLARGGLPTIQEAVLLYVVWFVIYLYISFGLGISHQATGTIIIQFLLAVMPLAACWYFKADFKKVYSVKTPAVRAVPGGIITILGGCCLAQLMAVYLGRLLPESMENVEETMSFVGELSFPAALFLIAAVPAVCEEIFFRGYVFCALRQKMKAGPAIVLTAFLFGLYHMSLLRLPITFLPGILLTIAVYHTGSIFISMLMHFINNAIAVVLTFYGDAIPGFSGDTYSTRLQLVMLAIAVVCIPVGLKVLNESRGQVP